MAVCGVFQNRGAPIIRIKPKINGILIGEKFGNDAEENAEFQ